MTEWGFYLWAPFGDAGEATCPRLIEIPDCILCGKPPVCRELLVEGGGTRWFALCDNPECARGPTVLRSLTE